MDKLNSEKLGENEVFCIWTEGPGIVHNINGHGIINSNASNSNNNSNYLLFDVMRSVINGTSNTPWLWWLSHDGITLIL